MQEAESKEAFEERAGIVLDELALGTRWERPCLVMAAYRSEHTRHKVQTILEKSLAEAGQPIFHYLVDKDNYDIPRDLMEHPEHATAVFFVSGLRWGGGRGYSNAYRALNMHREYLVDGKVKAVFWMTGSEARQLTRFAPDFWAFRHQVVEFLDLPAAQDIPPHGSPGLSLPDLYTSRADDFQAWIGAAERYAALGCLEESLLNLRKALRKYPEETAIYLQIAEIHLSQGHLTAARRLLKTADRKKTDQVYFLKELYRLDQAARSGRPARGGFQERMP